MEIKDLEVRMYVLAGQLEEAKKIYRDALGEIDRVNKANQAAKEAEEKLLKQKTETVTSGNNSTVSVGEPAAV